MRSEALKRAIRQARSSTINQFLKFVAAATYNSEQLPANTKPYNYNGDHLMRGENIAFTLRVKVIPYAP